MLYDELVPDGKYLAHYGIPKEQWSPAARAKYDREHGGNNKDNNTNKTNKSSKGYNPTNDYRSQARNQQLVDSGRRQIERASDIITNGNNLRNYWHNGRFIKRNEATDAYLRSRGFDPNASSLVATPKRPENRVNSGTRTGSSGGSGRLSDNSRKAAENKRNRSTRNGKNSKTWGSGKSRSANKPGPALSDHERYGWQNASSHRDAVEYDRRILQWNRGSIRAGVPGSGYGPLRPTIADDAQRTARRNRRNRR